MSLSTFDKTRASRTEDELRALVDAIHASPLATQETNWLQWKCLDLGATDGVFAIAKTILGFANRAVAVAELACEGVAYMVVGVEPQSAPASPPSTTQHWDRRLSRIKAGHGGPHTMSNTTARLCSSSWSNRPETATGSSL